MQYLGPDGVLFFFVLSGFLITFLILKEQEVTGSIKIRKFYLRRILRIWPLYYFALFLGFVVVPHIYTQIGTTPTTTLLHVYGWRIPLLFAGFAPNVAFVLFPSVTWLSVLWSIGSEEQFYLIWPWLLTAFKKRTATMLFSVVGLFVGFRFIMWLIATNRQNWLTNPSVVMLNKIAFDTENYFRFDCMAVGALGAYALVRHPAAIRHLASRTVEIGALAIIALAMILDPKMPVLQGEILGSAFLLVILNAAVNPNTIFRLDSAPLQYLGKISFGVYVYHFVAISLVIWLSPNLHLHSLAFGSFAMTLLVLIYTIPMAALSYQFLEKPFLSLKSKPISTPCQGFTLTGPSPI
jgi:peptidoglycan/LPS O-acetylase OafA/YrhL